MGNDSPKSCALCGKDEMLIKVLDCETGKYATDDGWSCNADAAKSFATLAEAEVFCVSAHVKSAEAFVIREKLPPFRVSLTIRHPRGSAHPGATRQNSPPATPMRRRRSMQ